MLSDLDTRMALQTWTGMLFDAVDILESRLGEITFDHVDEENSTIFAQRVYLLSRPALTRLSLHNLLIIG